MLPSNSTDPLAKNPPFARKRDRHPPRGEELSVARLIVGASDESPNGHTGRLAGLYSANAVLDHEGAMRIDLHPFGCVKKEVGRGLAALHHLCGVDRKSVA